MTRLLGLKKGRVYYLCLIMNSYSRCVAQWMAAERETAALASGCIEKAA